MFGTLMFTPQDGKNKTNNTTMDWTAIIMALLGGTSFLSVAAAIVYRKQNKALKNNEVKKDNAETQEREINLAELYKDKMLGLLEQVSEKTDNGNQNQHRILEKLDTLDGRMDKVEGRVSDIVTYLNGDFQGYLERAHAPKPNPRKPRKHNTDGNN